MVDIYSPSGKEEELTDYLEDFLQKQGLPVSRQTVEGARDNIIVSTGPSPKTLFLGHIDTVPAYDIEYSGFEERDGLCFGLGTTDMKGGCAAMIEAFVSAKEAGALLPDTMLALVVGEEEYGDGTQKLLEQHRFEQALVAEPTDLQPCLRHFGYVEMIVRAFGYRRHAAVSDRIHNAIRVLLRLLLQVEERIEQNEPQTVVNIRDLHSSDSGFAVPDRCAASLDLHIPPGRSASDYAEEIRAFVEDWLDNSRASRYEIEFPTLADGYWIEPDHHFAQKIAVSLRNQGLAWRPASFKSHSDANLLKEAGCDPIILGPGQLAKAHTIDESIDFNQVITAAEIYSHLLNGT
jgi:acetylornithine deacetylase